LINRFYLRIFIQTKTLKKAFYKLLAKLNKALLPSYSKQQLDLSKATKLQMAIIGWRYLITTKALD
tara:strand:- start:523 stop:720 length:198 start_codon:yes stop_codon:yes gene_type:complete